MQSKDAWYLVLEFGRIPAAHGDDAPVHVEFADDGNSSFQLRSERLLGTFPQAQEANENVLLRVFIGQEGLPATIRHVISSDQFNLGKERKRR